jgi:hypothetical protein
LMQLQPQALFPTVLEWIHRNPRWSHLLLLSSSWKLDRWSNIQRMKWKPWYRLVTFQLLYGFVFFSVYIAHVSSVLKYWKSSDFWQVNSYFLPFSSVTSWYIHWYQGKLAN